MLCLPHCSSDDDNGGGGGGPDNGIFNRNWIDDECKEQSRTDFFNECADDSECTVLETCINVDGMGMMLCAVECTDDSGCTAPERCLDVRMEKLCAEERYRKTVNILGSNTYQELDLRYSDSSCSTLAAPDTCEYEEAQMFTLGPVVSRDRDGSSVNAQEVTSGGGDTVYLLVDGNELWLDSGRGWEILGALYTETLPEPSMCITP